VACARFDQDPRRLDAPWWQAMLRDTIVPVTLGAGNDVEISGAPASVTLNIRLLPTTDVGEFQDWFRGVVGPGVVVSFYPELKPAPSPSAPENALVEAYRAAVRRHLGEHVPVFTTQGIGTTDSAALRGKGVAAYGVRPLVDPMSENAHGNNESIPVAGFRAGVRMYVEAVLDLAT
jgi:acetylornithine deacetylase/succinyl-diaminopimelate desuccinylase-like protein